MSRNTTRPLATPAQGGRPRKYESTTCCATSSTKRTVQDVISGKRDEVMDFVRKVADADAARIGVRVIDVRLKRVELEDSTLNSVYERMQSERKAVANQLRAEGSAEAENIKADADRQREVILAQAYKQGAADEEG